MLSHAGAPVVITGASSGIGRATARAFARRGARLTLAARRQAALEVVAEECKRLGGDALAVPTDVTYPEAVAALARAADAAYGAIDVWVNNAGGGVFGSYAEVPLDLHRRTIELNLFGAMYGAYAVLPIFRRQRRGVMINNISLAAWAPSPLVAAYTASKFGLRGFTASLRQELTDEPDIHVCGVFPAIIDTPGFEHGANFAGREIDIGPLIYAPEDVAETIVRLAERPRDEVAVGWPARVAQFAYAVARGLTERVVARAMTRSLQRSPPAPRTQGALLHPVAHGTAASGGWRSRKKTPSAGRLGAVLAVAAGSAMILGAMALANVRRERGSDRRAAARSRTE